MKKKNILLVAFFLFTHGALISFAPPTFAQGGVPLWTNRFGPGSVYAIAVDLNGNVVVTGESIGPDDDFVTIKYSNAGVPLWTNRYNGPGNGWDIARAVAVDKSGSVFVTGSSYESGGAYSDYATIKYSSAGVLLWTNLYVGPYNDAPAAIALDADGNVFVTGGSADGTNGYYLTLAYSRAGLLLWSNRYGPGSAQAIAVDSSGKVFVTGARSSANVSGDYATIAYSNSGLALWTNLYHAPGGGSSAAAVAVNTDGDVFVTGSSPAANGYSDYTTIKYSGAGVPLWTNRYNAANREDAAWANALDSNGNVLVTGHSYGSSGNNRDYATIKYSSAGLPLWTNRYGLPGDSDDYASAIVLDGSDNVFVMGNSGTIAYSSTGVPLWTNRFDGDLSKIAVDSSGNVFVTGQSFGSSHDYVTIKYSSSLPPPRLDFQLLSDQLVLSWAKAGSNLQAAPSVAGPFTTLPAATSPYTNPITAPQQFFRLQGN